MFTYQVLYDYENHEQSENDMFYSMELACVAALADYTNHVFPLIVYEDDGEQEVLAIVFYDKIFVEK